MATTSKKSGVKTKPDSSPATGALGGISSEKVEAATGKGWQEWLKALDKEKAFEMTHKDIAKLLSEKFKVSAWWSQMVTVGYEQAKGLRVKHQKVGGFEVSAGKTINCEVGDAFRAFKEPRLRKKWLPDHTFAIRVATENKSMRLDWYDGQILSVNFYDKGPGKCQVTMQHTKLTSAAEAEKMKGFWKERVEALKAELE